LSLNINMLHLLSWVRNKLGTPRGHEIKKRLPDR